MRKPRNINNTVRAGGIPHPNFIDARAHRLERLPVVRVVPALNFVQLKTGFTARASRKLQQRGEGIAQKFDSLHLGTIQ